MSFYFLLVARGYARGYNLCLYLHKIKARRPAVWSQCVSGGSSAQCTNHQLCGCSTWRCVQGLNSAEQEMAWGRDKQMELGKGDGSAWLKIPQCSCKGPEFSPSTHEVGDHGGSARLQMRLATPDPGALTAPSSHLIACTDTHMRINNNNNGNNDLKNTKSAKYSFNKFAIIRCLSENIFDILSYKRYITEVNFIFFVCVLATPVAHGTVPQTGPLSMVLINTEFVLGGFYLLKVSSLLK